MNHDWKQYERFVSKLVAEQLGTDFCVTPNARVKGRISGRRRQLDLFIASRHDADSSRNMIVDAKKRARAIDVTHVEAFRGLMQDVGVAHGYLVCASGFTVAAKRRAEKAVTISLLPLEVLERFAPLRFERCCAAGCAGYLFWDGFPQATLGLQKIGSENGQIIAAPRTWRVGKCDKCRRFHVDCLTCGDRKPMGNEDEHKCQCPGWFWLSSIEEDDADESFAELHLISVYAANGITVSRKPL